MATRTLDPPWRRWPRAALQEWALPKLARLAERSALVATATDFTRSQVGVVVVGWDAERTRRCVQTLSEVAALDPRFDLRVVVVANQPSASEGLDPGMSVLTGTNASYEFGGYDEGVAWIEAQGDRPSCYLLLNDRALVHTPNLLTNFNADLVAFAVRSGVVAQVDTFVDGKGHQVLGTSLRSWARSSGLLLPRLAVIRLGTITSISGPEFATDVPVTFPGHGWLLRDAIGIDVDYAAFVHSWLTGEGSALRSYWYEAAPVSAETWGSYRRKVYAILNEHLLSARCYQAGIPVVPVRSAEVLAEFPRGSARLGQLLADLRADPATTHRFVQSWHGRIRISRWLAAERLRTLRILPVGPP